MDSLVRVKAGQVTKDIYSTPLLFPPPPPVFSRTRGELSARPNSGGTGSAAGGKAAPKGRARTPPPRSVRRLRAPPTFEEALQSLRLVHHLHGWAMHPVAGLVAEPAGAHPPDPGGRLELRDVHGAHLEAAAGGASSGGEGSVAPRLSHRPPRARSPPGGFSPRLPRRALRIGLDHAARR